MTVKTATRARAVKAATTVKMLVPKVAEAKHIGSEPTWERVSTDSRRAQVISAFNWYNYSYGTKDAKEMVVDYLTRNGRAREAKLVASIADSEFRTVIGWLCRMSTVGLVLDEREQTAVNTDINRLVAIKAEKVKAVKATNRPNIQDKLREKLSECAGEMEGMYDEFLAAGCKMNADFKPLNLIRQFNVAPPLASEISQVWQKRLAELREMSAGKDSQLVEGYECYGKIQVRGMIKFAEQVIADCAAYVQIKKVERKPRAKKAVSPERVVIKLKYQKEDTALGIKSEAPAKIVGASELWLFDTKKRKLMHYVADSHVGSLTVKGTAIIGFDATNSTQKTIRKPAEQIKLVMGSKPAARKNYAAINAVETKLTGRLNENVLILKVY